MTEAEKAYVEIPLGKLVVRAVEKAYGSMLDQTQVSYWTNVFKKYGRLEEFEKTERFQNFSRAKATLRILLTQMGLSDIFDRILEHYETELHFNFEGTFIKILYRCLLGYRSIERLESIFALIE